MATDKVTNLSNASMPVLYHTRQWQTEAKHLADAELLEAAAGAPTLAPNNTSTSTTVLGQVVGHSMFSECYRL